MPISLNAKRGIFFAFILFILVGVSLSLGLFRYLVRPYKAGGPDQIFVVREGATLREVAADLEKSGIISSRNLLLLWTKVTGHAVSVKAGEYRLSSRMAPLEVLDILSRGKVIPHHVTIPEGFTLTQIAEVLEKNGVAERAKFLAVATDPDVAKTYGLPGCTLEGYLYPDTYRFSPGQQAASIVETMVKRFFHVMASFEERINASGMTLNQIITLASLIEKETGKAEERDVIASVFLNRLKKGMRLESDPTVIYGIAGFEGNLTKEDLARPSPYNTYVIQGLPPAPIASPGKEAIRAVLFPAQTDYLYFVSKNDGSHHFSKTLTEHNRAVNAYQRKGAGKSGEIS